MIREFIKADLPQMLAIEQTVHIAPWADETFKTCLEANCKGWVVEIDKRVIGFVIASQSNDECHILNLCVRRDSQHQGWGSKLMAAALQSAKQKGIGIAYLEVRRSNTRAINLYKKMKFQQVGERKNYYPDPTGPEDALVFAKSLVVVGI
jgi:ribosomal-protein-alanine N-acetyltransferase